MRRGAAGAAALKSATTSMALEVAAWPAEERHAYALREMATWPADKGMPRLPYIGIGAGPLYALVEQGLAERLPERDAMGESRFVLTEAGRAKLEEMGG